MSEKIKKILVLLVLVLLVVVLPLFLIFRKKSDPEPVKEESVIIIETEPEERKPVSDLEDLIDSSRLIGGLPTSDEKIEINFEKDEINELIEYISFLDFYEEPESNFQPNISDYSLPLNVRTDVLNYYDVSRKLNLDDHIDFLNNRGFAIIDNPWPARNFYEIYNKIYEQEMPFLISADFLTYYYQQTLKQVFKDIEENIFYNNLWEINRVLYEDARDRYEESLERLGDINDRVLEAQRRATAYFATSLELLKPKEGQVSKGSDLKSGSMFSSFEAEKYRFTLPPYLRVDVEREVELIKDSRDEVKSPVLLYQRDYSDFLVPEEYKGHAKLNNFYLTNKWLSSTFPLYYESSECPNCSLNFDDWRVSMITAAFTAQDIFDSYEMKNKWARIYKTLAFFKGLRGDLTYVHYRDSLANVFGPDYKIEDVFSDSNPRSIQNLYDFRNSVLRHNFSEVEGGIDKTDLEKRHELGAKMLTGFYWPNDYIFDKLSYPNVSEYKEEEAKDFNVTICDIRNEADNVRCNGFSLDIIALINESSLIGNQYYAENSNYNAYREELHFLRSQINSFPNIWHYNDYWKTLNNIKKYLQNPRKDMPIFAQNQNWSHKELHTSIGSWINLQLPPDQLGTYQKHQGQIIIPDEDSFLNHGYIEPNLALVEEKIANTRMIIEMFDLLNITDELRSVLLALSDLENNLMRVRDIIMKDLSSERLSDDDQQFIFSLALESSLSQAGEKVLEIKGANNRTISYDIGEPKLMLIISNNKGDKVFSLGPVFSYKESR
jgi:hypothetical protein